MNEYYKFASEILESGMFAKYITPYLFIEAIVIKSTRAW